MGKIFAILAAGAIASGGAAYAVFHHLDPYAADHAGCPLARMACCTTTETGTVESTDSIDVTAGASAEPTCCALAAKPVAHAACCADAAPSPAVAALVGPAAAAR